MAVTAGERHEGEGMARKLCVILVVMALSALAGCAHLRGAGAESAPATVSVQVKVLK